MENKRKSIVHLWATTVNIFMCLMISYSYLEIIEICAYHFVPFKNISHDHLLFIFIVITDHTDAHKQILGG